MSIRPLASDVVAQIKSSTAITSLNGVIYELVKNALDAGSKRIDVTVDYSRGGCTVEDDGSGILPSEFGPCGGLAKPYHSSKLGRQSSCHGGNGNFLSALSAMSLLTITSHHHLYHSHNSLTLHKTEVVARQTPASTIQLLASLDHGTRVAVRDLFGSMPVRVKQRAILSEKYQENTKLWQELRKLVVILLLAWPSNVAVTLRDARTHQKTILRPPSNTRTSNDPPLEHVDIPRTCRILSQASLIPADEKSSWVPVRASTSALEIRGTISLIPSATKHVQFVAFGIQPLLNLEGQNIIHDDINRHFQNSAFGNEEELEELDETERKRRESDRRFKADGYTNKELRGPRKGIDRWPMFYINIRPHDRYNSLDIDDVLDDKGSSLTAILELLEATLFEFLAKHHFRPKVRGRTRVRDQQIDRQGTTGNTQSQPQPERPAITINPHSITKVPRSHSSDDSVGTIALRTKQTKLDMLGTNIKLPSFRRSSAYGDNGQSAWSRLKGGKSSLSTVAKNQNLHSNIGNRSQPQIASTGPPARPFSAPTLNSSRTSSGTRTPLISSTGKVVRRPFEEVDEVSHSRPDSSQDPRNKTRDGDETMSWVNPVTKLTTIINQRTGNTVPAIQLKPGSSAMTSRRLSSRPKSSSDIKPSDGPNPWIDSILQEWENPIFRPTETAIPQVLFDGPSAESQEILHGHHHLCSQINIDRAFRESSAGINGRISKDSLGKAEVISQVDNKFILVKLPTSEAIAKSNRSIDGSRTLVIIDQHAADERIRIESLISELFTDPSAGVEIPPFDYKIRTMKLDKPLSFDVPVKEANLLRRHQQHFTHWGILYDLQNDTNTSAGKKPKPIQRLFVHSLPPGIAERCKLDPRLLIQLIRSEAYTQDDQPTQPLQSHPSSASDEPTKHAWIRHIHHCPRGILDMLNSRACRSAIMFNDELDALQCETLIKRLAECAFPFQCAHGRPSMVPLVDLGFVGRGGSEVDADSCLKEGFGKRFGRWKRRLEQARFQDASENV